MVVLHFPRGYVVGLLVAVLVAWGAATWQREQSLTPVGPQQVTDEHPIFLYDGVCALCNAAVQFVIARDPAEHVRFAAIQSDYASRLMLDAGRPDLLRPDFPREGEAKSSTQLTEEWKPDSMVLFERGVVHTHSTAALRLAAYLSSPWNALRFFLAVPRPFRDFGYSMISASRYYFGKISDGDSGQCSAPDAAGANAARLFLDRVPEEGCLS